MPPPRTAAPTPPQLSQVTPHAHPHTQKPPSRCAMQSHLPVSAQLGLPAAYLRLGASRPYAASARRASAPGAGASVRRRASDHARLISHLAPTAEHAGSCDGMLWTRLVAYASSSRSAGADRQSRRRDQAASRRLFWLSGRAPSSVSTSTLALRRPQLRRCGGAIRQHARGVARRKRGAATRLHVVDVGVRKHHARRL